MEIVRKKEQQGITLVALVVTIIVLLILAGITISLVLGQSGIFSKAGEAKEQTTQSQAIEKVKLAVLELRTKNNGNTEGITLGKIVQEIEGATTEAPEDKSGMILVDGIKVNIDEWYQVSIPKKIEDLQMPVPEGATIIQSDASKGIVIKDKNNNEWVWVEVPKDIAENATTDEEIENAYKDYVGGEWYVSNDTWYEGCGLTEEEYNNNKSKMLQSIKANGGFWIGRYEVGTQTKRSVEETSLSTPVLQQGKYPYDLVTAAQAQELSAQLNSDASFATNLLYGIQWKLTCKYIEEKGMLEDGTKLGQKDVEETSEKWGNYPSASFVFTKGKYSEDDGVTFKDVTGSFNKQETMHLLITTGSSERNKVQNIYDFAGNLAEWTLMQQNSMPIVMGGHFHSENGYNKAIYAEPYDKQDRLYAAGFRPSMYK